MFVYPKYDGSRNSVVDVVHGFLVKFNTVSNCCVLGSYFLCIACTLVYLSIYMYVKLLHIFTSDHIHEDVPATGTLWFYQS